MTTKPDFYETIAECEKNMKGRKREVLPTNPRYINFKQNIFTAGDEDQFQERRDATNGDICEKEITIPHTNLYNDQSFKVWDKNIDIPATSVINTFRYIFNKFKKGIFVKIKGGKVSVFLPFSKSKFHNEWSSKVEIPQSFKNLDSFLNSKSGKYKYNPKTVNHNMSEWYANNCLVKYDIDSKTQLTKEGDTNVATIKNMFEELCKNREIPDIEFFINRRDFPLITRNGTEPYTGIWGDNTPLVSHNYEKFTPIISMCKTDEYADVLSPTHEDWARTQSKKNHYFTGSCSDYNIKFNTPWNQKKPTAVFRGRSTGCGVTIDTNPRLKIAHISYMEKGDDQLLDAGIIGNWNNRVRKLSGSSYLQNIHIENERYIDSDGKLHPVVTKVFNIMKSKQAHV